MIVGQDRAGKTSLMKHLFGLPFDSDEASTTGINVKIVELTKENAKKPWTEKVIQPQPLAQGLVDGDKVKWLMNETKKREKSILISVHDLAGQMVYYETHQTFLRPECLYLLVHDLSKPLDYPAHPCFKSSGTGKQTSFDNSMLFTNADYLLMWVTALVNIGGLDKKQILGCFLPPALLTLTNYGRCDGSVEKLIERVKEAIRLKGAGHVFPDACILDNTRAERSGSPICELRQRIFNLCETILDAQEEFPVNWHYFAAVLSEISKRRPYISLQEATEVASECSVKSVDDALKFLHRHVIVIHPSGSDFVVLNPPWLMKIFTDIINVHDEGSAVMSHHTKDLQSKGILLEGFFREHRHGKLLKEMLARASLVCQWEHKEGSVFLVPPMAPVMSKGEEVEEILAQSPASPVFVAFGSSHVPIGLFARLAVKLINRFRKILTMYEPKLYCNYTLIPLEFADCEFRVYLMKLCEKIKLGVVPGSSVTSVCLRFFLCQLRESLISCFEELQCDEYHLYSHMEPYLVVKCSACFSERKKCLRHHNKNCKHDECGHFWKLDELQKAPQNLYCEHSSEVQPVAFSLERVIPWLQTESSVGEGENRTEEYQTSDLIASMPERFGEKAASGPDDLSSLNGPTTVPVRHEQWPPDHFEAWEIVHISQRIPDIWKKVALLTQQFEIHEISDIESSRIDEDASNKALLMLRRYIERNGSRKVFGKALKELEKSSLAQQVVSGHFIKSC